MKKVFQKFVSVLLLCIALNATAQSKEQKQVEEKVEQLRKAMVDADSVMLDKLASANLMYGHSGGHIDDKKEFVSKIASGKSDFVTIDLSEQTYTVVNKKIVVVRQTLKSKTNDGGKPADIFMYVMLVWEKQQGDWKLVARQAAKKL
ncbi:nuclear transport factor 2 family protein [Ferruginibacter sp.]